MLLVLLGNDVDDPPIGPVPEDRCSALDHLDTLDGRGIDGAKVSASSTERGGLRDAVDEDEDATPTEGIVALVDGVPRGRYARDEVADDRLHVR